MFYPEVLKTLEFTACLLGVSLVITGMESWMADRAIGVRIFFWLIGMIMLALAGNHICTWVKADTLKPEVAYLLQILLDWALVMAIFFAMIEAKGKKE